ncbi:hypothetical protein GO001_14440 [Streptomyces sp. NRRL B-1677]|uniref:hypothetical protein n=1 Tax=Streptomyces sp. NRRL B-1677 TaxID=2682966 RepID=UPI001892C563|nr:hypothetical protein [Streptomyces sp. NRRL B-1677]MBF6046410.1 hypothetical protein [Streptomyces sp. NRRL B-1677]
MSTTTTQRPTLYMQVDGLSFRPERISLYAALNGIRAARKNTKAVDTVNVYAFTDRTGTALHVAYIHYTPGHWGVTDVDDVTAVYEIPTDTLTDL